MSKHANASDFEKLIEPHWTHMARFARHIVAADAWEDVLQEALTTAWRKRRQYDSAKGSVRNWLLAIVADKAYKNRRRKVLDQQELVEVGYAVDHTRGLDLRQAVASLAPRQRQAITLHYYLALTTTEIAQVMNCSTGTVTSTLSHARRQLHQLLGEDYHHA